MNRLYARLLYQKDTGLGLEYITKTVDEDGSYQVCEQCSMETYHRRDSPDLDKYIEWLESKVAELQEQIDEPIRNEKNKGSLSGKAVRHIVTGEATDTGV